MKVALVHDWLVGGGAEKVVLELHKMFPEAPIYTSFCTDEWREKLDNKVVTGYLQYWPFSKLRKFLPVLRQLWFNKLDLGQFDLVISSSGNGEAKFVRPRSGSTHVCYCHTPPHYYWSKYDEYLANPGFHPYWLVRLGLRVLVKPLRKRDYEAAQKVDHFIANSNHIKADIKKYYGQESVVIHPPVDIKRFNNLPPRERKGFITVGRQIPYKRTDLVVAACTKLNLPLVVVGKGPDHEKLTNMAGPTVTFVTEASDEAIAQYLSSAEAFLFASEEDFGITPVEAMAAGTPVIAYKAGGALDYVIPVKTGMFFDEQTVSGLVNTLESIEASKFDPKTIKKFAEQFNSLKFQSRMKEFIRDLELS